MEYQQIFERVEAKYVLTDGQYDQLMKLIGPHLTPDLYPHPFHLLRFRGLPAGQEFAGQAGL